MITDSQASCEKRHAWHEDEEKRIIPDGGRVTVPMAIMDSMQQAVAQDSEKVHPDLLTPAESDRIEGFRAHYAHQREQAQQGTNPSQAAYEQRLAGAWRNPAPGPGEVSS